MRSAALAVLALVWLAGSAAAQAPLFVAPTDAAAPRRSSGYLVDCGEHGGWRAPAGWEAGSASGDTFAIAPDGDALIVRARLRPPLRDDATFAARVLEVATRWIGRAPDLGAVRALSRDRWHRVRDVEGTAERDGARLRVVGHAEGRRAIFVAIHREGDDAARAAIEAALTSWVSLTDHACVCGYDCDRRPAAAP